MLDYLNNTEKAPMPYRGATGIFKVKITGLEFKIPADTGDFGKCDFKFQLKNKDYVITDILTTDEGQDINRQRLEALVGIFELSIAERDQIIGKDVWASITKNYSEKHDRNYYSIDFLTEEAAKEA